MYVTSDQFPYIFNMPHFSQSSIKPQNRSVYHEDPFMDVHWHDDVRIPRLYWKKFSATGAYRKAMDKLIELASEKRAKVCWLDMSALSIVDKEDQTWIKDHWMPRIINHGVKHIAVAMPEAPLAKSSLLKGLRYDDPATLEIGYFNHPDESLDWLIHINNSKNY